MKVCYFGTYRQEYSRNKIMIAALESAGNEVICCHQVLWHGIQDRVDTTQGGWKKPRFWFRVSTAYVKLIWRFVKIRDFDILMVGYPGQFDVFLGKFFSRLRKKPLVWDVFMSIYLVAMERGLDKKSKFTVNFIRWIESKALNLPDLLIQDTSAYVNWFHDEYGISPNRFRLIPTGADDRIFKPIETNSPVDQHCFTVLYYGTYIPNHGVMKIAEAINLLREREDILFEFIGDGPDRKPFEGYIVEHGLKNIRILDWMNQEELLTQIAKADICLGAFGDTPQSMMTVQNKIYECLAMGKPVITGESPAISAAFPPDTIVTCSRKEPENLAKTIENLRKNDDYLQVLSRNARAVFLTTYSISSLGQRMNNYLDELVSTKEIKR